MTPFVYRNVGKNSDGLLLLLRADPDEANDGDNDGGECDYEQDGGIDDSEKFVDKIGAGGETTTRSS